MKIHATAKEVRQAGAEHEEETTVVVDINPDAPVRLVVAKMRELSWYNNRFSFTISVDGPDDTPIN